MNDLADTPFLKFLRAGIAKGGFQTDDALAAMLPLLKQVRAAHEAELVAPLDGLEHLTLTGQGQLRFAPDRVRSPEKNSSKIEALQAEVSQDLVVVAEPDPARSEGAGLPGAQTGDPDDGTVTRPVYLPGYRCWEHAIKHHDELTDIFSLGMLLASVACGLDFTDAESLEVFTANRTNLFAVNRRLNPVMASVIGQMTELNRHRRAPDLAQLISRLENYRDQAAELDLTQLTGFKESGLTGKRRLIQAHLRDRLFEISRRNHLLYFRSTLQTLNLTLASVPLLLDYRHLKVEQLFVWHPELAATLGEGAPLSLGKYLRFEDAPYIPEVLDKIASEARRARAEFGFAQLRLVLCFLRWNNLKEAPDERIHSPLLLLPVELTRKKGVRDSYVLAPESSEAEVNPALRHYLKELYDLSLPELVDLKETSLDQFWETLRALIQASEPAVSLNKLDRPQIELVQERAQQRLDQYRRRLKRQRSSGPLASVSDEAGLQREQSRRQAGPEANSSTGPSEAESSSTAPPSSPAGASTQPEPAAEVGPQVFTVRDRSVREGTTQNPYVWDFDLCNLTLGNFNYRKMTLVRDYAKLIETDMASGAFDAVFSLSPKSAEDAPGALELTDQHLIVSCDAAQASAITRARTGASYIIQGPPGTGKSQTITNLIADFVARGKRVLFVCEKRAAIDVVFQRLRQQGLDELCCLIHDSQTDKRAFIQNLKQTSEQFLTQAELDADAAHECASTLRVIEQDLAGLRRFSETMRNAHTHTGIPVRSLLHRLVELRGRPWELPPQVEEILPEYPLWLEHGEVVERLRTALAELGQDLRFGAHPLAWLGPPVLQAERPIERMSGLLDQAEDLLDGILTALELAGVPSDSWDTIEEIQTLLEFAVRAQPLAERGLLGVLTSLPAAKAYESRAADLDLAARTVARTQKKMAGWKEPLSADETQHALAQAQALEGSLLRFLHPSYWRLRKTLQRRYNFNQHAVPPSWSKILKDLGLWHQAQAEFEAMAEIARQEWRTDDVPGIRTLVEELRADPRTAHPSVKALLKQCAASNEAGAVMERLASAHARFVELKAALGTLLAEHEHLNVPQLTQLLANLREQTGLLAELAPVLVEWAELPERFQAALRRANVPLNELEAAVGHKSLNQVYRQDRAVQRLEGRVLARKLDQMEKRYRKWLALNARRLRAAVRQKFLEHVRVASLPAAQLEPEQKVFKKSYAAGRRELEHEFGKTMRYKSIRDLAAGETGQVIQDLKPIWLMSPLSVSDTLPLDPALFDVVIFDEASQIPLEEAIPALYRSHQVIIVGDEMQLPPTTFFAAGRSGDETVLVEEEGERVEVDLDSDSFLTQSGQNLPATLLAWHYRSRYESLISFSNAAFYSGNLFTIPDRQRALEDQAELQVTDPQQGDAHVAALLARSISFHFMENAIYENRTNSREATYIAHLVRGLLRSGNKLSIGIVAFSEAQQSEIEDALGELAETDAAFSARLESEYVREEEGVFCGLFVKNLENVQGDERDIMILSVCYGPDPRGRILMNFGPINQRGGEKRLNVIFSRAKQHMAIVSSIRHHAITNDYNDGANRLKNFLQYAQAVSKGDAVTARRVLESLNPLSRKALAPLSKGDAVVESLATALRSRGYVVDLNVGQSRFRCDLAVRSRTDNLYTLGILVDTEAHYSNPNLLDRYLMQPGILRAFGWRCTLVLSKDWYHNPDEVVSRIEKLLHGEDAAAQADAPEDESADESVGLAAPSPTPPVAKTPPRTPESPTPARASATTPTPASEPAPASHVRHLEFVGGASRKFWEITVAGNSFTVRFGRIGTAGQSQMRSFPDAVRARREADKLITEKLEKGYTDSPLA